MNESQIKFLKEMQHGPGPEIKWPNTLIWTGGGTRRISEFKIPPDETTECAMLSGGGYVVLKNADPKDFQVGVPVFGELHVLMFNEWAAHVSSEDTIAGVFTDWDTALAAFEARLDDTFKREEIAVDYQSRPRLEAHKEFEDKKGFDVGITYTLSTHPMNRLCDRFKLMIDKETGEVGWDVFERRVLSKSVEQFLLGDV